MSNGIYTTATGRLFGGLALTILLTFSSVSNGKGIYPKEVSKLPSIEIADAVEMFFPPHDNHDNIYWDHLSEGPILWMDDGYISGEKIDTAAWLRRGLLRINIRGKKSYILKKTKQELAWNVTYRKYGNPNFGVDSVSIEPGTLEEVCFSPADTFGCDMDPIPSFTKKGYKMEEVCAPDGLSKVVYLMKHKGMKDRYLSINANYGSGGVTVSITLWFDNKDFACDERY